MRISLNWLKDYLDIKPEIDVEQISRSLTLAGLEVEAIEYLKDKAKKLILGVISSIREHDKKIIYDLIVGDRSFSVLGEPSLMAKTGMVIACRSNEVKKQKDIQGEIANFGDLGFLTGGHNEVIAFPQNFFEGEVPDNLAEVKEFDDVIFTLSITPNRADALSHLGVSRELCALLDLNSRSPMLTPREMAGPTHERVVLEIESAEDCPRYACRIIENVLVQESPIWIKLRLIASGVQPINNVVDVVNYVMLSRGQPLHAFDYDKLQIENQRAKIIVRRAALGEKLVTLDKKQIVLTDKDLVISDGEKILALAGIIGGLDSSISQNTTQVLLESAYFEPKNVRMSARHHGIMTDSSYRFERGVDPNGVIDALNYAARLLTEISEAKICRELIDTYRKRIEPQEIKMRPERAQDILGIDVDSFNQDLLRKKFLRLGIETVAKRGDAIYFRVPTYRSDLSREIDLIEEAARMIGYDKVKESTQCFGHDFFDFGNKRLEFINKKIKETLCARGFLEAINYAFLNKELQDLFIAEIDKEKIIELKNPLSDRYGVMRLSLLPGLIKNLLHNQRNQEKSVLLFESGTVFLGKRESGHAPNPTLLCGSLAEDSFCLEKQVISGVIAGEEWYQAFDHPKKVIDFYHLKGILIEIFQALRLSCQFPYPTINFSSETKIPIPYLHPGESSVILYQPTEESPEITLGHFGKLHPQLASKLDIVGDSYVFELDTGKIADVVITIPKFKPFSRYPIIERDVAFLIDEKVQVGEILRVVEKIKSCDEILTNINVFDIYRGKNIEIGKKSIAISLSFRRSDRTLTDDEVEAFVNQFVEIVEKDIGAKIR
jgi:phenylalanyl-tRNA synthetase beta chain